MRLTPAGHTALVSQGLFLCSGKRASLPQPVGSEPREEEIQGRSRRELVHVDGT